jgi:FixJ family two-component response regulator
MPTLPVIIMTSETSVSLEKRAREAGAAAFLRKPCTPEVLTRTVARVGRKPRSAAR